MMVLAGDQRSGNLDQIIGKALTWCLRNEPSRRLDVTENMVELSSTNEIL